jgi:hypothetical protein
MGIRSKIEGKRGETDEKREIEEKSQRENTTR